MAKEGSHKSYFYNVVIALIQRSAKMSTKKDTLDQLDLGM